jgi:IclR family transcriptional regulator, KDG regulon repressor
MRISAGLPRHQVRLTQGDKVMNRKPRSDKKVYRVQAVERALDILDCFDFHDRELSLTEICRRTGLNKSTALRLTSNLVARKFLRLDDETGRYSLGMRLFDLGSVVFSAFSLRKAASKYMTQLQQETSATVLLGVLMDQQLVYVDKRDGEGAIRISSDIGWRRAPHFGMLGMVLMSSLPSSHVDSLLDTYPLEPITKATIIDPAGFKERLIRIAKDGFVAEHGEAVDGIIGIAAPVMDYSRRVVAAIGVAILEAQHDRASVARVIDSVRAAAEGISSELGFLES